MSVEAVPMLDPVAKLAARLLPVPALVFEITTRTPDSFFLDLHYGPNAVSIAKFLWAHPFIADQIVMLVPPRCEGCGGTADLDTTTARTAYNWDGKSDFNPNHPRLLCPPCTEEHHTHWDSMWDEYHANLL
jgi:hypothetical protein